MWKKIAKGLSIILHPYLIPTYIVLIILCSDSVFALFPLHLKLYMLWVSMLYSLVLPIITYKALQFIGRNNHYIYLRRHKRVVSLSTSACCYLLGAINFMGKESLGVFFEITTIGLCCCITMLVVLKWWRVSPHMISAGAAITLISTFNIIGHTSHITPLLIAILLCGALASARLYLGYESPKQVTCSFIFGFMASVIMLIL